MVELVFIVFVTQTHNHVIPALIHALKIKMAAIEITKKMEQRKIMKFLINESIKPVDIYRRLSAQDGHDFLSRTSMFDLCKSFKDGRESVQNEPLAARPATSTRLMLRC